MKSFVLIVFIALLVSAHKNVDFEAVQIKVNVTGAFNIARGFLSSLFAKLDAPQAAVCMNISLNIEKIVNDFRNLIKQKFEFINFLSMAANILVQVIGVMDSCYDVYVGFDNIYKYMVFYWQDPIYWFGQIGLNFLYNLIDFFSDLGIIYTDIDEGDFYDAGQIGGEFVYNVFFITDI